ASYAFGGVEHLGPECAEQGAPRLVSEMPEIQRVRGCCRSRPGLCAHLVGAPGEMAGLGPRTGRVPPDPFPDPRSEATWKRRFDRIGELGSPKVATWVRVDH